MRRSTIGLAAGAAALCATSLIGAAVADAATSASAPVTSTVSTTVRPVTKAGHAAPGYTVKIVKPATAVDCSYPSSSPAAVNKDILTCSPSAAYAVACWRSATAHHVLCLTNATSHKLIRYPVAGKIARTSAPKIPAPLQVKLAGGTICTLRDGGSGSTLVQHPSWAAYYYCTGGRALWAPMNAKNGAVSRAHKAWTVQIASDTGKQKVKTAKVAHAWFVGTRA